MAPFILKMGASNIGDFLQPAGRLGSRRLVFDPLWSPPDRLCGLVIRVLATDPEARVRFPALPEKKSSGSGTGSTQPREYN
jgi:hypothetical protein